MIAGTVTADREAIIHLSVLDPYGQEQGIEAVVDTGFDGWLSLPPTLIGLLGLPWRRRAQAILADGSVTLVDMYEGVVVWDGNPLAIPIDSADTDPLVGMSLIYGYELNIQAVDGGLVTLTVI
jgi:clan AA aspartic protease